MSVTTNHPYFGLSIRQLELVCTERDISLDREARNAGQDNAETRANLLLTYDEIMPTWINEVRLIRPAQITRLSLPKVLVYGNLRGVNVTGMVSVSDKETIGTLLSASKVWTLQRPQPRPFFQSQAQMESPSLTSILERCREGCCISTDKILSKRVLSTSLRIDQSALNRWVMVHTAYPPMIDNEKYIALLQRQPDSCRVALRQLAGNQYLDEMDFYDDSDIIFALSHGYPSIDTGKYNAIGHRYNTLVTANLPDVVVGLFTQLYRLPTGQSNRDILKGVARANVNALEQFILLATREKHKHGIKELSILPPYDGISTLDYYIANVLSYEKVTRRNPTMKIPPRNEMTIHVAECLTDNELIQVMGAYWIYTSRHNMIARMMMLLSEPGWFAPIGERRCLNAETTLLTERTDMTTHMLAFGTLLEYHCYEFAELSAGFHQRDEYRDDGNGNEVATATGGFVFTNPHGQEFTKEQVEDLRKIVTVYRNLDDAPELLRRIELGLHANVQRTTYDNGVLRNFRSFSREEKLKVDAWLLHLFDVGMYLRRWRGKGHPYPVTTQETKINIEPEVLGLPALLHLSVLEEAMTIEVRDFVKGLRIVQYYATNVTQDSDTVKHLVKSVNRSTYCIRMASSRFVSTAYHYHMLFFGTSIGGVNPREVTHIQ
jgi:hypothetical protein